MLLQQTKDLLTLSQRKAGSGSSAHGIPVPDVPKEVSSNIKSMQNDGAVLGLAVSRSSKTKLYLGLSHHLYNMNLPHVTRVPVAGYVVDIAFPGALLCIDVSLPSCICALTVGLLILSLLLHSWVSFAPVGCDLPRRL